MGGVCTRRSWLLGYHHEVDFADGKNLVLEMQKAAEECERILPILSLNYFLSVFTQPEWAVAFGKDPTGEQGLLIPVRVKECDLEGLWPQIVYIDLFNKKENEARKLLLAKIKQVVKKARLKPKTRPKFAGFAGDSHNNKKPLRFLRPERFPCLNHELQD